MKKADRDFFDEHGYVVIKQVVKDHELEPLREDIGKVVDRKINELHAQGHITDKHDDLPLSRRWAEVNREYSTGEQMWVRQVFGKAIYDLGIHPNIVDVIEALIGSEIRFNGDYHVRPKLPHDALTVVPWHQDAFYYGGSEAGNPSFPILSVWIPLVDVNEDNGCLQFVPGNRRRGLTPELNQKIPGTVGASDEDTDGRHELDVKGASLCMGKGDMVVFDKFAFHRSLPNIAKEIRWNVDLRYSPVDQSFEWSRMGAEIDVKYPSFIVKSRMDPDREMTWEQFQEKFLLTTDRYDENGKPR